MQNAWEAASITFGVTQIASERPPPLPELSEAEAVEWRRIVDRMPADWFTAETWPVLGALCRHTVSSHAVGRGLAALSAGSLDTPERISMYRQLHEMLLADNT